MQTKLVLIGYGQMGKMLDAMSGTEGFEVVSRIDPALGNELSKEMISGGEIAIEFSEPGSAVANITRCLELGLPVVSGTTGWHNKMAEVRELVEALDGSVLYGANFSIGMNIFYEIVRQTAEIMNRFEAYDVYGYELHHRYKKDSPSGTAKELSRIILEETDRKARVEYNALQRRKDREEFQFASVRGGEIPGEHRVGYDSEWDTIELRHTARSRRGLAAGAFMAARWLLGKRGLYSFDQVISEQIKSGKSDK